MRSKQYRRWHPLQSPLDIEFPSGLMDELRAEATEIEATGVLYGVCDRSEVLVLAAHADAKEMLEAVGIFVTRIRGEVFLTESNLSLFETQALPVALVIAGGKGGFFVRESSGLIQTVRSHEEFSVVEPGAPPAAQLIVMKAMTVVAPLLRRWSSHGWSGGRWSWPGWSWRVGSWKVVAIAAFAALPLAALAYLHPIARQRAFIRQPPVTLRLQEESGQLRISWKAGGHAILVIEDGAERSAIPVFAGQSNTTYVRRNTEVEVTLISLDERSVQRRESRRFVGTPPPVGRAAELRAEIAQASAEADRLRSESAAGRARIASLEQTIGEMTIPPR